MSTPGLIVKPGVRVGDYEITEQIAIGGFGTVWRARQVDSGLPAAIKILHPHLISAETLVLRFQREARAIAALHHPNIVELYAHGRLEDGRPYLVMEYLDGVDLGAHIALRGTLSPHETLGILDQLCQALATAHAQGIVHRDLKASNVFLTQEGGGLRVVLFDFGIAKLLSNDGGPQLTMSSSLLGSPACMSPEQILGKPVDVRTDVYALGSLTYHMLVGQPPFSGTTPTAILTMHLEDYPPYPSLHGDVSPAFDEVVMKAMSKDPAQRFPGVMEFMEAFRAALYQSEQGNAPREQAGGRGLAIGLYVDVSADSEALEEPDDALLDDLDAVAPQAARILGDRGYVLAEERGSSALFVHALVSSTEPAAEREQAMRDALSLFEELAVRDSRDPRVHVSVFVHVAEAQIARGGAVHGGELLEMTEWASPASGEHVLISDAALRDVNLGGLAIDAVPWSSGLRRLLRHDRSPGVV